MRGAPELEGDRTFDVWKTGRDQHPVVLAVIVVRAKRFVVSSVMRSHVDGQPLNLDDHHADTYTME